MLWNTVFGRSEAQAPSLTSTDTYNSFCFVLGEVEIGKKEGRRIEGLA